ncbi:MAG: HAD family hydrolase [Planctomycetes bacterium]|nr:HAD family hydrolase [Planctomycetota bacterium]
MSAKRLTAVPYAEIDALFVDAGNTLVLMDYALLAEGLLGLGVAVKPPALARAEAASRPELSRYIARGVSSETAETRRFWVGAIWERLAASIGPAAARDAALLERFASWIDDERIWGKVFSVVPAETRSALARVRDAGIKAFVVSNSNGRLAERLAGYGLAACFDGIVDSGVIGIEKPNPGIFRHALALAATEPARALHAGDLHAVDVVGARGAGIHAALVDPFGDWGDVADCERVPDLAALVERLLAARGHAPARRGRGGEGP